MNIAEAVKTLPNFAVSRKAWGKTGIKYISEIYPWQLIQINGYLYRHAPYAFVNPDSRPLTAEDIVADDYVITGKLPEEMKYPNAHWRGFMPCPNCYCEKCKKFYDQPKKDWKEEADAFSARMHEWDECVQKTVENSKPGSDEKREEAMKNWRWRCPIHFTWFKDKAEADEHQKEFGCYPLQRLNEEGTGVER